MIPELLEFSQDGLAKPLLKPVGVERGGGSPLGGSLLVPMVSLFAAVA